jgi:hypothetical protein
MRDTWNLPEGVSDHMEAMEHEEPYLPPVGLCKFLISGSSTGGFVDVVYQPYGKNYVLGVGDQYDGGYVEITLDDARAIAAMLTAMVEREEEQQ